MPTIVEVPSHSNPAVFYRVDVDGQRCSCAAWKFQKAPRKPCKHLIGLRAGRSFKGQRVVELDAAEVTKTWPKAPELDL